MQSLNLIREFKLQRMKEYETIKEYSDRLLGIANRVNLFGTTFVDSRIVEKILVIVLEKCEASITILENTKDLSKITLAELLNALQSRITKTYEAGFFCEGALPTKHQDSKKDKKNCFQEKSSFK